MRTKLEHISSKGKAPKVESRGRSAGQGRGIARFAGVKNKKQKKPPKNGDTSAEGKALALKRRGALQGCRQSRPDGGYEEYIAA
jgi:hypothetical protein